MELATKVDNIVVKEKDRKKRRLNPIEADNNEEIIELRKELKEEENKIIKNKMEIQRMRRNLDNKYDINKIVEKENELKYLKIQLENLDFEKESLEKIQKTQDKVI